MQLQPHHAAVPPIGPRGSIRITRLASNEFRSVCHAVIACWPGVPEELPCSVRYPTSEQGKQSRPATTWATSRAACSRVLQVTARGPQSAPPPCLHPDWLAQCCCQGYTVRRGSLASHSRGRNSRVGHGQSRLRLPTCTLALHRPETCSSAGTSTRLDQVRRLALSVSVKFSPTQNALLLVNRRVCVSADGSRRHRRAGNTFGDRSPVSPYIADPAQSRRAHNFSAPLCWRCPLLQRFLIHVV